MSSLSASGLQAFRYEELRRDPDALAYAMARAEKGSEHHTILLSIAIQNANRDLLQAVEPERSVVRRRLDRLIEERAALVKKLEKSEEKE